MCGDTEEKLDIQPTRRAAHCRTRFNLSKTSRGGPTSRELVVQFSAFSSTDILIQLKILFHTRIS